jgi:hypothetical protein
MPINVTLDGVDRGDTPVVVDDLVPGTHEVRYLAPGTDPWTDTFQARIGETVELVAQPFSMPETGVIEVRATVLGPEGNEPVKGAAIFVDGELRGSTPAEIELPRGPHSIRLTWKGSDVPVQVIDLPGGNHRYADFSFGTDVDAPRLTQVAPGAIGRDQPSVAAAAIRGIAEAELREMWLHVRSPEGAWKRYPMTLMRAPAGIVGVAVFPSTMLAESGDTPYYMSAMSQVGDEYFTEVRKARSRGSAPKSESRSRGSRSSAAPSTSSTPSAEATTP